MYVVYQGKKELKKTEGPVTAFESAMQVLRKQCGSVVDIQIDGLTKPVCLQRANAMRARFDAIVNLTVACAEPEQTKDKSGYVAVLEVESRILNGKAERKAAK